MRPLLVLAVACGACALATVGYLIATAIIDCRRQHAHAHRAGAGAGAGAESEHHEARRRAVRAARTELDAASRQWQRAQNGEHRVYVYAGQVRTVARAAERLADAIANAAATGCAHKPGALADGYWRLPAALGCEHPERPSAQRWQRFDRAAQTLAATVASPDSELDALARA